MFPVVFSVTKIGITGFKWKEDRVEGGLKWGRVGEDERDTIDAHDVGWP